MSITKYNKKSLSSVWNIDTKDFEFFKAQDIELDVVHRLYGLFISKGGKYGDSASAILSDKFVSISNSYLEEVQNVLNDNEAVEEIKQGKVGIKFTKFHNKKYNKDGYAIEFVEL